MSQLHDALSRFDEDDYTTRLCRTMFGALPTAPPFVFYRDLAGGVARVAERPRPDLVPRAAAIAQRREAERALWLAAALDKADKGLAMASGVTNLVAFIRGSSAEKRSTFESDQQQAIDAGIKLLGLAYITSRLFQGGPTEKVDQLLALPAGREAALYLATVEIALPFLDNFIETGGSVISKLMESSAVDAASRFGAVAGRSTTEEATSVLSHLVQPMESLLEGVKGNVGGLLDTLRSHVPSALGLADSATGVLATTLDAMPVWQFLGARLVAEACAQRALDEQSEPAAALDVGQAVQAQTTDHDQDLVLTATVGDEPDTDQDRDQGASISAGLVTTGAAVVTAVGTSSATSSLFGATAATSPTAALESDPTTPAPARSMTTTYVRFLLLLVGAIGGALLVRAYPDLAWNQLEWVRAQPQWLFAGFTGALGLVMFRLGIDLSRDWPVGLGAALAAGSLAAGVALAGSRRFIIGGNPDSPYLIPVGLLVVLLVIGAVRLRLESSDE